ncbi:hypothetical protein GIB67_041719 [Kingdonia uniflora]|uniref:mitogen-activated protein kinase kinase n=1 Tax=Kingdonia uniflora TaxID=39325 RepID=A0A7J7MRB8_9MAGN|nr:hypothetical protein GIB67_041719 [Kingdonia uniflora]
MFYLHQAIQMSFQEDLVKQIAQELKINQSAQCPYVAVWYQSLYDNGVISIILEYMDGGSLADFLKKVKTIPEPYLASICKQASASVLKGLLYLHHEKHIIHRDMKPSNLLINHGGQVKITDFGVSAILANTTAERNTFIGTSNYMSPERINGGGYGYKSDIWSLGLVLLECATGRFPYSPPEQEERWSTMFDLLEAIVVQPPPCARPDQFSPEFCSFISACVQKDPKERLGARELMLAPEPTITRCHVPLVKEAVLAQDGARSDPVGSDLDPGQPADIFSTWVSVEHASSSREVWKTRVEFELVTHYLAHHRFVPQAVGLGSVSQNRSAPL